LSVPSVAARKRQVQTMLSTSTALALLFQEMGELLMAKKTPAKKTPAPKKAPPKKKPKKTKKQSGGVC
jgi:hypothetical protein